MNRSIDAGELRYAEEHILMLLSLFSRDGAHLRTRESVSRILWPHIAEQAIENLLTKGLIIESEGALEIAAVD